MMPPSSSATVCGRSSTEARSPVLSSASAVRARHDTAATIQALRIDAQPIASRRRRQVADDDGSPGAHAPPGATRPEVDFEATGLQERERRTKDSGPVV